MKPVYYYDGNTTVCLLVENKQVLARGLSICSRDDVFFGSDGRDLSRKRALEALGRQKDCCEIRLDAYRAHPCDIVSLSLARDRFGEYKGYYQPVLTPTEIIIINMPKSRPRPLVDTRALWDKITSGS
jgi:hypothetical protein